MEWFVCGRKHYYSIYMYKFKFSVRLERGKKPDNSGDEDVEIHVSEHIFSFKTSKSQSICRGFNFLFKQVSSQYYEVKKQLSF